MSTWISVTDRMPDVGQHALCATADGQVIAMTWEANKWAKTERGRMPRWIWMNRLSIWTVTHWMPFPTHPNTPAPAPRPALGQRGD